MQRSSRACFYDQITTSTLEFVFLGETVLLELAFFEQMLTTMNTLTSPANTKKSQRLPDVFSAKTLWRSSQFSSPGKNLCHAFCGSIVTIWSKDFNSPQERNNSGREVLESERQNFRPRKKCLTLVWILGGLYKQPKMPHHHSLADLGWLNVFVK